MNTSGAYVPISNSVLPDANIWFSTTLHAWFGLLAAETLGSWSFHWTEDILAEASYHKRRKYPESSSHQIEAIRKRLMEHLADNEISGFPHDNSVNYPDIHDAHVHSAAVHAKIQIIVTDDRKGFDRIYDDPDDCPYDVYTADEFLMLAAESAPQAIDTVLCKQWDYYCQRYRFERKSFNLVERLKKTGCDCFAEYIRDRQQKINCNDI